MLWQSNVSMIDNKYSLSWENAVSSYLHFLPNMRISLFFLIPKLEWGSLQQYLCWGLT